MQVNDPRIGKYYVCVIRGLHLPVKIIKWINTGYLCRYYRSAFNLMRHLYKDCKCECKSKCMKRNLICIKEVYLVKELDNDKGKILVGE